MAVTVDEAIAHLNLEDSTDLGDLTELALFVDAANEWMTGKIADTADLTSATVRLATLFLVAHLWNSQRGPAASPLVGDEIVTVTGTGYAIPNRVLELIEPFRIKARATYSFPDAVAWPDSVEWPAD